jgi:hypothetical protein
MASTNKLIVLAGLSLFALSANAQVSEWIAKCQATYDRSVENLPPLGPPPSIIEPERLSPREVILRETQSLKDDTLACEAQTDASKRAACLDIINTRTQANQQALYDAQILEKSDALIVSDVPRDPRRVEGISGAMSPRARKARDAKRRVHKRNADLWKRAESEKKECLAYAPINASDGICPRSHPFAGWSDKKIDVNGESPPPDLCHPPPKPPSPPPAPMSLNRAYRLGPARPIRVAFNGGTPAIREAIRGIAKEWADATNGPIGYTTTGTPIYDPYRLEQPMSFNFGKETAQGFKFNTWSHDDIKFAAEIRISFYDNYGNWSLIGTESVDPGIGHPGEASMNLDGMHGLRRLPADWQKVVFHEFGHALGLQHEHQHPISECGSALRMEDDKDYTLTLDTGGAAIPDTSGRRPGVITLVMNAPNYWSREDAAFNLEQLKTSGDLDTTAFDPNSIMRYEFATEWYRDDAPSECLPTGKPATRPSKMDFAMVTKTYKKLMPRSRSR